MQVSQTFPPIKITYESLPKSPLIKWPLVKVHLATKSFSMPQSVLALVDSGASESIMHPALAEILGFSGNSIKYKAGGTSVSGGYQYAVLPEKIAVNLYGYRFKLTFTAVNNPQLPFACILGENSVFQWARIDFQRFKGFFELKFRKDLN